jgi:hypothetical protein
MALVTQERAKELLEYTVKNEMRFHANHGRVAP